MAEAKQVRTIQLSREGATKLQRELDERKKLRLEIAKRIETARSFGDLSENGEYDAARNEQSFNEGRIQEIETMLDVAVIVEADSVSTEKVSVGTRVRVYDEDMEEEETYIVVGATEADPAEMKISTESPMGMALLDHKVGDVVVVQIPGDTIRMRILEIGRAE